MDIVVYGAGGNGRLFYQAMQNANINILFFIDEYTQATEYQGIPIKRISEVEDKSLPVLVSVAAFSTAIAEDLGGRGFSDVSDFNQSVVKVPQIIDVFLPIVWWYEEDKSKMLDYPKLEQLRTLFADQTSHQVLDRIIGFRENISAETYLTNDAVTQYFPEDIDLFSHLNAVRMIDCGAFTGDTLAQTISILGERGTDLDFIALMEPDNKNLEALQANVKKHKQACDLFVLPAGAWSSSKILQITSNGASSQVTELQSQPEEGAFTIPVVGIDEVFYGAKPNYIKMDIEGAEVEAIEGAKQVIADYSPVLAICLYHRGSDLWNIPLRIHEINPNYNYYLRVHGDMGLETVIYCVPKM
ncbi:FkbM family methyltransferase [Thiomicrorhabdus indica]|uniref:FkbM family methyltransferase n=1 Tax=Thiomicrorhabdus indica TaxID=2267253 RepID=UPI002AA5F94E|nr:FkbM family methyltransferase [Thiomicrorhabdus indica]